LIQKAARKIEKARAQIYQEAAQFRYSRKQWLFLHAATYKIERLEVAKNWEKALDDIIDAYNYLALLYKDLVENGGSN
jgi:hypothetical protein